MERQAIIVVDEDFLKMKSSTHPALHDLVGTPVIQHTINNLRNDSINDIYLNAEPASKSGVVDAYRGIQVLTDHYIVAVETVLICDVSLLYYCSQIFTLI